MSRPKGLKNGMRITRRPCLWCGNEIGREADLFCSQRCAASGRALHNSALHCGVFSCLTPHEQMVVLVMVAYRRRTAPPEPSEPSEP